MSKEYSILKEVILKRPLKPSDMPAEYSKADEKQKEQMFREYITWHQQFSNIARAITDRTGYWYVGSSISDIADKIRELPPEKLSATRKKVADLIKQSRAAEREMNKVKVAAKSLLDEISK